MTHVSEHEEHDDLHAAFGDQVERLTIGASPVEAVMRGGAALRTRRRIALTSSVAALAVLPVAAVAVFTGSGSGSGSGSGGTQVHAAGTATTAPVPTTEAKAPETGTTPTKAYQPIPSPTGTHDAPADVTPIPPNPDRDDLRVLASGAVNGQHWRLVRDRFAVADTDPSSTPGPGHHLPKSQWGQAGTSNCEMLGLQWGDRAVGTFPDFHAGGHCRPVRFGSAPGHELIEDGQANVGPYGNTLTELTGRVDASKVATVTLIVGDRSSGPQPVLAGTGENDGYYVFVLDRAVLSDQSYTFTLRDAAGRVLGVFDPRSGFRS